MSLIVIGLDRVLADLNGAVVKLETNTATAVAVTARKVQQGARERIAGHKYLPQYPASISYDVKHSGLGVEAEIGPDKGRRQGALGNIVEYGTSKNAPLPHLGPALEENAEDLAHGIEVAVWQAMR